MTAAAPIACAMGVLVLSIVLAIGLIPVLDAELRRVTARRAAAQAATNDNDTSAGGGRLEMSDRSALHREVAHLRERVDVLEEEVRQLRDAFEPSVAMPTAWRLTKTEARLLHLLTRVTGGYVTRERILTALYGLEPDVEIKIIDVFVCKIRKKLAAAGSAVEIRTFNGDGFGLTADARAAFRAEVASGEGVRADGAAKAEADDLRARLTALASENARLIDVAARRPIAPVPMSPAARPRWSWRDLPQRNRRRR